MMSDIIGTISITDAVVLAGLLIVGIKALADERGWTRSTALVRQENTDLRERNATLDSEVKRLDDLDRDKAKQIAVLQQQVDDLKSRDQEAVLVAIRLHETNAASRFEQMFQVQVDIRDHLRAA